MKKRPESEIMAELDELLTSIDCDELDPDSEVKERLGEILDEEAHDAPDESQVDPALFAFVAELAANGGGAFIGASTCVYEKDLPMLVDWHNAKVEAPPGSILLFEIDDHFEAWFGDASRVLSILGERPGEPRAQQCIRRVGDSEVLVAKIPAPALRSSIGPLAGGEHDFTGDMEALRLNCKRDVLLFRPGASCNRDSGKAETVSSGKVVSLDGWRARR